VTTKLFTSIELRDLVVPNRIMVSPMGQYSSHEGSANDRHLMHYGSMSVSIARGGHGTQQPNLGQITFSLDS
jgi:2,4-dienoyl-CoA reductase-like NADH-dependent reductase (Old Yellow Enzyme family)